MSEESVFEVSGSYGAKVAYDVVAVTIFAVVTINFLFPSNRFIPLDRRTVGILGATLCYITRAFLFPSQKMDLIAAVDFDVLVLLAGIMAINHIVVHLRETKAAINWMQRQVQDNPVKGFWLVSFSTFIVAPFLTNDGVCLLFVEIILKAFDSTAAPATLPAPSASSVTAPPASAAVPSPPLPVDTQMKAEEMPQAEPQPEPKHTRKRSSGSSISSIKDLAKPAHERKPSYSGSEHRHAASLSRGPARPASTEMVALAKVDNDVEAAAPAQSISQSAPAKKHTGMKLERGDAVYFLMTLACSSNIGSALTYTGNPQNMIVAQDAIDVLPPIQFLAVMIIPSLVTWLMTTFWIQWCWMHARKNYASPAGLHAPLLEDDTVQSHNPLNPLQRQYTVQPTDDTSLTSFESKSQAKSKLTVSVPVNTNDEVDELSMCGSRVCVGKKSSQPQEEVMSPRQKRNAEREEKIQKFVFVISSPFPYMMLILVGLMIIMIFVDVMSISGLVCVTAVIMVTTLVVGNLWAGKETWGEVSHQDSDDDDDAIDEKTHAKLSYDDRMESINEFFESLFASLDYSLLIIFLGIFVVVANVESTGLPTKLWSAIVGDTPFDDLMSITGISTFVLLASQTLGNVAVIQLARPNVEMLDDYHRAMAWAVLSFVATIGGNLTITGSAANIIVAEKANRIDPKSSLNFFNHFWVCFTVTLVSCVIGGAIIIMIVSAWK